MKRRKRRVKTKEESVSDGSALRRSAERIMGGVRETCVPFNCFVAADVARRVNLTKLRQRNASLALI